MTIRPYAGLAQRTRNLSLGPVAPWHATIHVDEVTLERGRQTSQPQDHVYEVIAEWFGPPAVGMPKSDRPVCGRDVYALADPILARAVARAALDAFAKGGDQAPDLRDIAADLRRRG